ncbi:MAG: hypothetical protein IJT49_02385 [Clostridia bacterium]|nr:hypothetical protein [Clostridia bacterium]
MEKRRKFATLTKGNTSVSYKYNSDGIRYEKTVNGVKHKYYLMGSTITSETIIDGNNTTKIEYFYDSYGPYGFSIDGTFYYYVKNLQCYVTQIRDENCALIASYVYDAWGKVLSVTENTTNCIGAKNAIRYRGYYYDTESNLYYLNARYYDPQIKRFLNPDSILGANEGVGRADELCATRIWGSPPPLPPQTPPSPRDFSGLFYADEKRTTDGRPYTGSSRRRPYGCSPPQSRKRLWGRGSPPRIAVGVPGRGQGGMGGSRRSRA